VYGLTAPPPRTKTGRPFERMTARMNITITPELRHWLYTQDEDASALIRTLLEAERVRRGDPLVAPDQLPKDRRRPGRRVRPAPQLE
jgi:hypothetical protein